MEFKKSINKSDYKQFKKWIQTNSNFFSNPNYLTELINLGIETKKYSKNYWEFFIFNFLVLKNRYSFYQNESKIFKSINKLNLDDENIILELIFLIFENLNQLNQNLYTNSSLKHFFKALLNYRKDGKYDIDQEYKIVEKYWEYIDFLIKNHIKNFNNLLILINKNSFIKQGGILRNA